MTRLPRTLSISAQIVAMISAGPFVVATVGLALVPLAARVALADRDPALVDDVASSVRIVLLLALLCGAVAAVGAGAVLRSSIGGAIRKMRLATDAIAQGDFVHRVDVVRADELGILADGINSMAVRLERLEAGRRRLLADVSHELRTPLTVIRSQAWASARGARDPGLRHRLEVIEAETRRLATLVDDLFDAATIHAGGARFQCERADLLAVVADAADRFRSQAQRAGVAIELDAPDVPMPVEVDVDRFHQALGNLLTNAIAHAPVDSVVEVSLEEQGRSTFRTTVSNSGTPIPPVVAESIFEPFVQGTNATGRAGLGLPIARDIAERLGGALTLVSSDRRTVFALDLPRAKQASAGSQALPARSRRQWAPPGLGDVRAAGRPAT